ncbi:hypothetical protein TgHK011_010143 [Trichoderma gracile]|nr:hypothetical protein TgHK011_010143 [Trichoderma gracile]
MKSLSVLTTLAVAALVSAAPQKFQISNSTDVTWNPAPSDQTTCEPSSFSQAPIPNAADWRVCAALLSAWASENGTFSIRDASGGAWIPVLKSEGCTLGVKASQQGQGPYIVGDEDVKDIFNIALEYYSEGTDLSVEGSVNCDVADGGRAGLNWQIYRQ